MTEQDREQRPQPRNIDTLQPAELEQYYAVPGWRVWSRSIFANNKDYRTAFDQAAEKPLALICHERNRGYGTLYHWEADTQDKPRLPLFANGLDMPSFLLEPLSEDEVKRIDEQGETPDPLRSIDKPNELFRPEDLRRIAER